MSENKMRILIVDDDENITRYLLRVLRMSGYEIKVANSGKNGLDIVNREHIDMIISDMLMPEMSGYTFLSLVKVSFPHIIRVILSGDQEIDNIIKAVADGTAQSYLTKPISNNNLKAHIDKLFKTFRLLNQDSFYNILKINQYIQVLPSMYNRLFSLFEQENRVEGIVDYISNQPEYAAKILQIANSSIYGSNIGSVSQAVKYLGLETIKQLVTETEVFRFFISDDLNCRELSLMWSHSRMTNKYFHAIYQHIYDKVVPDIYHCCGLLHDTGLLLMIKQFPEQYVKLIDLIKKNNMLLEKAEYEVFGFTHASIGAYLLQWWNLPFPLIDSCLYHHDPLNSAASNSEICSILCIADYFSLKKLGNKDNVSFDNNVFNKLGLDENEIESLLQSLNDIVF